MMVELTEANILAFLRSAPGSASYKRLPLPKKWDVGSRPHVAVLDSVGDVVFCFFLSSPSAEGSELDISDIRVLPIGTVVEVRYSALDYRYFRRDEEGWRLVGEVRSHLLMEIYNTESLPVVLSLYEDRVLAAE